MKTQRPLRETLLRRRIDGNWLDIGTSSVDDYYYKNLGFDIHSLETAKYRATLDKLYSLLGNRGLKRLKGHEAIHLIRPTGADMWQRNCALRICAIY